MAELEKLQKDLEALKKQKEEEPKKKAGRPKKEVPEIEKPEEPEETEDPIPKEAMVTNAELLETGAVRLTIITNAPEEFGVIGKSFALNQED